eukprot:CAMPEP_0175883302 /NCGR_PEP_ID=MMETSP0107_2-20121207/43893_1 /TAXON_ID=195067 ORGANISM="Goniomonas pacifica, Strain CCMP1869" /NCGR_SAMPLE_ID=MMETSP0107_2 /ASSEMBLY_ACC=CAM_ASM_000203 /LENGTH=44 /DNA_ID= /DNA_START= /DNA_END= /DNA_ORIENTATION=
MASLSQSTVSTSGGQLSSATMAALGPSSPDAAADGGDDDDDDGD